MGRLNDRPFHSRTVRPETMKVFVATESLERGENTGGDTKTNNNLIMAFDLSYYYILP